MQFLRKALDDGIRNNYLLDLVMAGSTQNSRKMEEKVVVFIIFVVYSFFLVAISIE